jgi:hypothetical protein
MNISKHAAARLCCLLLAACAQPVGWTRPGADAATSGREYQACLAQVKEAIQSEIGVNEDILATRGSDWQRAATLPVKRDTMHAQTEARTDYLLAQCMRKKGFQRAK